jgi:hypothetical protein
MMMVAFGIFMMLRSRYFGIFVMALVWVLFHLEHHVVYNFFSNGFLFIIVIVIVNCECKFICNKVKKKLIQINNGHFGYKP